MFLSVKMCEQLAFHHENQRLNDFPAFAPALYAVHTASCKALRKKLSSRSGAHRRKTRTTIGDVAVELHFLKNRDFDGGNQEPTRASVFFFGCFSLNWASFPAHLAPPTSCSRGNQAQRPSAYSRPLFGFVWM